MLIILVSTWRRYSVTSPFLLMMICLWLVPPIFTSAVIFRRCVNFFDYGRAVSYWPTFKSYLDDGLQLQSLTAGFVLAMMVAGFMGWRTICDAKCSLTPAWSGLRKSCTFAKVFVETPLTLNVRLRRAARAPDGRTIARRLLNLRATPAVRLLRSRSFEASDGNEPAPVDLDSTRLS